MRSSRSLTVLLAVLLVAAGLSWPSAQAQEVTTADLEQAAADTSSWLMYGRDYHGHRFVDLDEITPDNVGRLHPAWVFATGGDNRGLEATPLVHEGVIYLSADESRVFAIDARTGAKKWGFAPEMSDEVERVYCCGSNNRGVALFGELVYVGTMDARLIALHKDTGAVVWETVVVDWRQGYSITGAPLVVNGMVLTGVAGGEYGIRGFVKAYDAQTGELRWTTYTIPGPGEPGNETWPGDTWKHGGAPTWTTGAYDPELNLVYWNTGNAAPWNCHVRKGDNQWSAATVAIDADDGAIRWGFQYTPWDCWDYDAVSTPVLADVTLRDHGPVKALFHHDKNGFFYALDRTDGRFLYGEPIVPGINWAFGLDPETGRPEINPDMLAQSGGPEVGPIIPSLEGAIDWQPLAFNPDLGALYFMSNQWAMGYRFWAEDQFEPPTNGEAYLGGDYQQYLTSDNPGNFVGFDVVEQKVLWRVVSPAPFWAGAVATSSGLVFTGDMRGYFMAIDARSGDVLWQFQTGSGIIGSPITYQLDGTQYVAVPSGGIGGDMTFYYTEPKAGNLWVFALDGGPREVQEGHEPDAAAGRPAAGRRAGPHAGRPGAAGIRLRAHRGRCRAHRTGHAVRGARIVRTVRAGCERRGQSRCRATRRRSPRANGSIAPGASSATGPAAAPVRVCFGTRLPARPVPGRGEPEDVEGTNMPAFEELLSPDELRQVHAFLMSRDAL